jgi:hypothetical protein
MLETLKNLIMTKIMFTSVSFGFKGLSTMAVG